MIIIVIVVAAAAAAAVVVVVSRYDKNNGESLIDWKSLPRLTKKTSPKL